MFWLRILFSIRRIVENFTVTALLPKMKTDMMSIAVGVPKAE
jgi:hypothetical protein